VGKSTLNIFESLLKVKISNYYIRLKVGTAHEGLSVVFRYVLALIPVAVVLLIRVLPGPVIERHVPSWLFGLVALAAVIGAAFLIGRLKSAKQEAEGMCCKQGDCPELR
jgi:hypothetical protein